MQRVVSFDFSITDTGWAAGAHPESITFGTFSTKHIAHTGDITRMSYILEKSLNAVESGDLIVIEDFAHAKSNKAHLMGGLGWLVRYHLWKNNQPFILVGTGQLKKFITGSGKGQKSNVMKDLYKRWKIDVDNDNAADAVVLNLIGQCILKQAEPTAAFERVVLKEVCKANDWVSVALSALAA